MTVDVEFVWVQFLIQCFWVALAFHLEFEKSSVEFGRIPIVIYTICI
jgi:hypothetical protein